jgi:hypothetical protein
MSIPHATKKSTGIFEFLSILQQGLNPEQKEESWRSWRFGG